MHLRCLQESMVLGCRLQLSLFDCIVWCLRLNRLLRAYFCYAGAVQAWCRRVWRADPTMKPWVLWHAAAAAVACPMQQQRQCLCSD